MSSRTGGTKKKDAGKASQNNLRSNDDDDDDEDDEIRAELEAMTNLEYNLHSDFDMARNEAGGDLAAVAIAPLFSVTKKSRAVNSGVASARDSTRHEKPSKSENDGHSQTSAAQRASGEQELRAVMRQAATTSEEKYRILEARDRLMRASRTDRPSMERVTRGTCPDMCPEKERLMREWQRRVAPYELLETAAPEYRINNETAVKQYSRSSADQEEPLPQDLRPVESLRMTMSYLLHEIADLCEKSGTNLAEWYHFLWDRTRGVRKDITQQELCCLESVGLVEQCARFHIVCAERLCAEEVSVFDKKINTENLTKCLQTLKYMYHDLRGEGIICENEPEFRAYVILLNLNSGNFMWEVQRLPERIQKSEPIKFAMEVHSCVESNNYAKFFRLVRETTYLNACILLRYFNQVRVRALSVMVKAYCRTSSTAFPLYELIDILGFEDENEAVLFCEQLGLNLSKDELHIMLDRRTFCQPMGSIEQARARNYVESKRINAGRSIGQCIAGRRMPEKLYVGHRPHDSFDSRGYLKSNSLDAEDQIIVSDEGDSNEDDCPMDEDIFQPPEPVVSSSETRNTTSTAMMTTTTTKTIFTIAAKTAPTAMSTTIPAMTTTRRDDDRGSINESRMFRKEETPASGQTVSPASYSRERIMKKGCTSDISFGAVPPPFVGSQERHTVDSPRPISAVRPIATSASRSSNVFAKFRPDEAPFGKIVSAASIFGNTAGAPLKNMFGNTSGSSASTAIGSKCPPESMIFGKTIEQQPGSRTEESDGRWVKDGVEKPRPKSKTLDLEGEEMLQRRIDREAKQFYAQLEAQVIGDVCGSMLREEMDRTKELCDEILARILDECIREDCEEMLDREISFGRKLMEIERRARHHTIHKYYGIWREVVKRKRQQRGALDQTPVWLQKRSLEECAKSLYRDDQKLAIDCMRRKRLRKMSNGESSEPARRRLMSSSPPLSNQPLEYLEPIESKIYEGIRENARILGTRALSTDIYWKMVISWPPRMEDRGILSRYKKITNEYLCPSDHTRLPIVKSYRPNSHETLRVCIDVIEGVASEAARLAGTDGLLLIATSSDNTASVLRRLTTTLVSRGKLMPIPVVVAILPEDRPSPRQIRIEDGLARLVESGHVSEYTVTREETIDEEIVFKLIQDATLWLTLNKSPPAPLEMHNLGKIVDACLTDELWLRILGDSSFNEHLREALRDVHFVIDLHNEAVNHLSEIFLDPESLAYTDFPSEFDVFAVKRVQELPRGWQEFDSSWRSAEDRALVERTMNDLSLPKWKYDWPIDDPLELEKSLVRYHDECLGGTSSRGGNSTLTSGAEVGGPTFVQILLEIVKEKVCRVETRARAVYNKNHVRHFRDSPWWFKSGTLTRYRERTGGWRDASSPTPIGPASIPDESPASRKVRDEENDEIAQMVNREYERLLQQPAADSVASPGRERREQLAQLRDISDKLEKTLLQQRSRGRSLEKKLSLALGLSDDNGIF